MKVNINKRSAMLTLSNNFTADKDNRQDEEDLFELVDEIDNEILKDIPSDFVKRESDAFFEFYRDIEGYSDDDIDFRKDNLYNFDIFKINYTKLYSIINYSSAICQIINKLKEFTSFEIRIDTNISQKSIEYNISISFSDNKIYIKMDKNLKVIKSNIFGRMIYPYPDLDDVITYFINSLNPEIQKIAFCI